MATPINKEQAIEITDEIRDRFWSKVEISENHNVCWNWKSFLNTDGGYGAFKAKGVRVLAHRLSYIMTHGSIPLGYVILHKCDNKICVNPAHLSSGTQKENVADAITKKRMIPKGRSPIHPSYGAYRNRGCRCVDCVRIYREFERSRRKRYKERKC